MMHYQGRYINIISAAVYSGDVGDATRTYVDQQDELLREEFYASLLTTSGDIVSQIVACTTTSGLIVGSAAFSLTGTTITHNLGDANHFVCVTPSNVTNFDETLIEGIGNIYIKRGARQDVVYHTGDERADGTPFMWQVSGDFSIDGMIIGSDTFSIGGTSITHNLGVEDHFVAVTPSDLTDFDEEIIASLGNIYVKRGANQDIVSHTGDARADVINFMWQVSGSTMSSGWGCQDCLANIVGLGNVVITHSGNITYISVTE